MKNQTDNRTMGAFILAPLLLVFWSVPFTVAFAQQAASGNIVVNGDFQLDADGDGFADGWRRSAAVTTVTEGENRWLRIDGAQGSTSQTVPIRPDWWKLRLSMRMRVTDVVRGDESWKDGRLAMSFHNEKGERVGPWPNVFHATGTSDWTRCEREYSIPAGAATLVLNPANFGPSGRIEFDDIVIEVSRLRTTEKYDEPLPAGVTSVWDLKNAFRETTESHERICLNGLWRFRPAMDDDSHDAIPPSGDCWGWFKVPGIWPAGSFSSQSAAQMPVLSPWILERLEDGQSVDQAWYLRTVTVPENWQGRAVSLEFTMLQTHARVFVDSRDLGEVWFPGGAVDVSSVLTPGSEHALAILVTARPLEAESNVFMAPDRIIKSKADVKLKGITGDVFLCGEPRGNAVGDVHVITSVQKQSITFDAGLRNADISACRLSARVTGQEPGDIRNFACEAPVPVVDGRVSFTARWENPRLWDTDTPQYMYTAEVSLCAEDGRLLDAALPVSFGFREFRIEGRDFLLNGTPIHLRALHNRTINSPADMACREGAANTLRRMQAFGFNFLITGNYNFSPGAVSYMEGLLTAADASGMLVSFSLPHVKDYGWKLDQPEQAERYREFCRFLIRQVQNHPSLVTYAMTHNATGYYGDQNPLKIDGIYSPDSGPDGLEYKGDRRRNTHRQQAEIAADLARSLDPTRPIYHHQSGNLGDMHTVNIYLNWAPMQERNDWLEHWSSEGVKPLFFVEWGLPHISSWSSYRGPQFIWRCQAYQSIWNAEFASAYLGDSAYRATPEQRQVIDTEETLWARGKPFAWGEAIRAIRNVEQNHVEIMSLFASQNWRAHRTWGISAMLPWDQGEFWTRVEQTPLTPNQGAFVGLNQPGIVPDQFTPGNEFIYDNGEDTFVPTSLGQAFLRWNKPLCAYLAGAPDHPADVSHNVSPGMVLHKSLVILNDTRRGRTCRYTWKADTIALGGNGTVSIEPGRKAVIPIDLSLPGDVPAGELTITADFVFDEGTRQHDRFVIDVLPLAPGTENLQVFAFDPRGETTELLQCLGIRVTAVTAEWSPKPGELLVIGREALAVTDALPWFQAVPDGLRVLVFEQSAETLSERLGFRINVHGLRRTFPRVPDHPALAGLSPSALWDWTGSATLTEPCLQTDYIETGNPKWTWCGFSNTRVWRCGNRGNVASVLIEKPPRGNWLPIVDGGFDLQYAPLLETTQGKGRVIFCQMDVTGRTVRDPAADRLCTNLVRYLVEAPSPDVRTPVYTGDQCGGDLLEELGITFIRPGSLEPDRVWIAGPGAVCPEGMDAAIRGGLTLVCLGLTAEDLRTWVPEIEATETEAGYGNLPAAGDPELTGISNAELYWRTKPRIAAPADTAESGSPGIRVLHRGRGRIILCQAAPWHFDVTAKPYLRTTQRRNLFLVSRLLANLGIYGRNPLLERLAAPVRTRDLDLAAGWVGLEDPDDNGQKAQWWQPGFADTAWKPIDVPGTFEQQRPHLAKYDGLFWYRLRFTLPEDFDRQDCELFLGGIDDESWVWLNGTFLGEITKKTNPDNYWSFPRSYPLSPDLLLPGRENVLAVRVNDTYLSGGITGKPRLHHPGPWLKSYYIQVPEAIDDPYRYYRW